MDTSGLPIDAIMVLFDSFALADKVADLSDEELTEIAINFSHDLPIDSPVMALIDELVRRMSGTGKRLLTEEEVYDELHCEIKRWGTQRAFADICGVSGAYMSDVVNKRRVPGVKILDKLGIKARTIYQMFCDVPK